MFQSSDQRSGLAPVEKIEEIWTVCPRSFAGLDRKSIPGAEGYVDAERAQSRGLLMVRYSISGVGSDMEQQVWGSLGGRELKRELLADWYAGLALTAKEPGKAEGQDAKITEWTEERRE